METTTRKAVIITNKKGELLIAEATKPKVLYMDIPYARLDLSGHEFFWPIDCPGYEPWYLGDCHVWFANKLT